MTSETSQHDWFAERIATYLTDGMSGEERREFESHAAGCAECAGKLAWAKGEDDSLRDLFAEIAPSPGFEDRVIQRLRRSGWKMAGLMNPIRLRPIRLRPVIVRAATAAAAIVLVGGLGYWTVQAMQGRREQGVGAGEYVANDLSNLRQMGQATLTPNLGPLAATQPVATPLSYSYANPNPDTKELGGGYRMGKGLEPTFAVAADIAAQQAQEQSAQDDRSGYPGNSSSSTISQKALSEDGAKDELSAANKPAPTAAYTYDSELKAPAPGEAESYEPASVDAAKSVENLQSEAAVSSASAGQTTPPAPGEARRFGGGGFGGGVAPVVVLGVSRHGARVPKPIKPGNRNPGEKLSAMA